MKRILLAAAAIVALSTGAGASPPANHHELKLEATASGPEISRDIFGQFAEMLGEGIYGGIWVGKDSPIPNVRGIRSDVVGALRELRVPNVRWPGGCYADGYHWRDGIGANRTSRLNSTWGGVIDANAFGTHEFMDFVEQIGSDAYISVNIGSGTVQEASDWVEYMTAAEPTTLAKERMANGRAKPWKIKFLGLGNESWGCGGMFKPEEYTEKMRQFGSLVRNMNPEQMRSFFGSNPNAMMRIGVGEGLDQTEYTEAVMKSWKMGQPFFTSVDALSLHRYTGSMTFDDSMDFGEREYAHLLSATYEMDRMIVQHSAIMDRYDPKKEVPLAIDEWGAWLKPLPGKNQMFLRQQNSIRDGILAAINLNIFARHGDRVRLANIAQMINVIQSMILTRDDKMILTPTYHVFRMYRPFQDATLIPIALDQGQYRFGNKQLPQVDAIAALGKDGRVWIAVANIDPNNTAEIDVSGLKASAAVGQTLTADRVNAVNTFENPNAVVPRPFSAKPKVGVLTLRLAPKSVTVVSFEGAKMNLPVKAKPVTALSTSTTPLSEILVRPDARAIVDRHIPGFSANAQGLKDVPIRQLRIIAPDTLTDEVLTKIDADFKTLKP